MSAILFPTDPTRLNYVDEPWVDASGKLWLWQETKQRWTPYISVSGVNTGDETKESIVEKLDGEFSALVLESAPSDYFPETITIDGNDLFHAGGNNWSTDGSPEVPPTGTWYLLFYTGTSWFVDIVVDGEFSDSLSPDEATPATVFPNFVSWTGHTVTGVSENHTDGKLGQDAIVNETDVYKCVSETPVKWTRRFIIVSTNAEKLALTGLSFGQRVLVYGEGYRMEEYIGDYIYPYGLESGEQNWKIVGPNTFKVTVNNGNVSFATLTFKGVSVSYSASVLIGWIREDEEIQVSDIQNNLYLKTINGVEISPLVRVSHATLTGATSATLSPIIPPRAEVTIHSNS